MHLQIQPSRFECPVTEYILTLMFDKFEKQEIISTTNNGHYLNDLLPSIEYKIKLTAKTSNGLLETSPIYIAIPLMEGKFNIFIIIIDIIIMLKIFKLCISKLL